MAKVTSKMQVTIPKAIAERHGIKPGDEIEWVSNGTSIRVLTHLGRARHPDPEVRVAIFDAQMERIQKLQAERKLPHRGERGWRREDLYDRGFPR